MKTKEINKTIDFKDYDYTYDSGEYKFEIKYRVDGKNIPATWWDPPEYAEIEYLKTFLISRSGKKMREIEIPEIFHDDIDELLWEREIGLAEDHRY